MADRVPRRAGPLWVWVIGLIVLVVAIWLLIDWVGRRDEVRTAAGVPASVARFAGAPPPAEVAERVAALDEVARTSSQVPLLAVLPFGPANDGTMVSFEGENAGPEVPSGLWVRTTAGPTVFVWVVDAGGQSLVTGKRVQGTGVVRRDPERVQAWMAQAAMVDAERASVESRYYIETTANRLRLR